MRRLRKQLEDLEKEMLSNHRELVNLETELARRLSVGKVRKTEKSESQ